MFSTILFCTPFGGNQYPCSFNQPLVLSLRAMCGQVRWVEDLPLPLCLLYQVCTSDSFHDPYLSIVRHLCLCVNSMQGKGALILLWHLCIGLCLCHHLLSWAIMCQLLGGAPNLSVNCGVCTLCVYCQALVQLFFILYSYITALVCVVCANRSITCCRKQ